MIMKNTRIFISGAAALAFVLMGGISCDRAHIGDIYTPDELGATQKSFYVDVEGGDVQIDILANKEGNVETIGECPDWLTINQKTFANDASVSVSVGANNHFQRHARLLLSTPTRKDTVTVYQYGAVPEQFYVSAGSVLVYNGEQQSSIKTDINVPLSTVDVRIAYPGRDEWVKSSEVRADEFVFTTIDNPSATEMRRAYLTLSHINGWGEKEKYEVVLIQPRSDNHVGTTFSAEQLRELATTEGTVLPDDAFIEGVIVSTTETGQAGDISCLDYQQGTGVVNYELNDLTAYMQSVDGRYGFKLLTETADKNGFKRFTRVGFSAGGAVVSKTEDEPVRYTISGVDSHEILTQSDASLEVAAKQMYMSELTDDDIYTYVTLKDCEIPMRKGPLTPINEGYTKTKGYNRLGKHPMLIRDIEGSSMYMMTNVTCPYRRDGSVMPYGSGNISGVIVHEIYKNFEKNGNIGRYQIRHFTREEIALEENFENSFSALAVEFRYADIPGEFDYTELPNAIRATYGKGELCHTYGTEVGNFSDSYVYLGPTNNKKGEYANGAGIILEDGSQYLPVEGRESAQNPDAKCCLSKDLMLSWSHKYWWDSSNGRGYSWLVKFTTKNITSDRASLQFAMHNNSQSARSPRYWKAEYSLTTSDCGPESDDQWTLIGEFTCHDVAIWASQNDWQLLGTRVYDFPLPVEILGQESVCIRLTPRNNKAAAKSVDSYDSSTIANNSGYNTMDYFAVRYNK